MTGELTKLIKEACEYVKTNGGSIADPREFLLYLVTDGTATPTDEDLWEARWSKHDRSSRSNRTSNPAEAVHGLLNDFKERRAKEIAEKAAYAELPTVRVFNYRHYSSKADEQENYGFVRFTKTQVVCMASPYQEVRFQRENGREVGAGASFRGYCYIKPEEIARLAALPPPAKKTKKTKEKAK